MFPFWPFEILVAPLFPFFFGCFVVFFHLTAGSTVSPLFSRNRLHCHTHSLHALSLIDSNQYILWSTPKTVAHSRVPWVRQTRGLNVHRHFHLGYAPTSRCPSHKGKKIPVKVTAQTDLLTAGYALI